MACHRFVEVLPELPTGELDRIELLRLQYEIDALEARIETLENDLMVFRDILNLVFMEEILKQIGHLPFAGPDIDSAVVRVEAPLIDLIPDPHELIDHLWLWIADSPKIEQNTNYRFNPFGEFEQEVLIKNLTHIMGITQEELFALKKGIAKPGERRDQPVKQVLNEFCDGLYFYELFDFVALIEVKDDLRKEHHHIIAGTGHGKTQTIQNLIAHDLVKVARQQASIIVIDSQGDMINMLKRRNFFARGGGLEDKLVLIEPKDIEYPVCLNLFQCSMDRIETYDPLLKEQTLNSIMELFDFVFTALLDIEMTGKQGTLFRYITRLLLEIPDATIHTLLDLMINGLDKYQQYVEKLPHTARSFFEVDFNSNQFTHTKEEVRRRLWTVLENQTFERMLSHPQSKLDMFQEMNAGKVILISTAKDLLKQNGTEIFGRFFIALIIQAALERAALPKEKRLPCYVYIDECQDYMDSNIKLILEQARKYNISLIFAHQSLSQLDGQVRQSVHTNTSVKMVGGVSANDAAEMSHQMRCKPQQIDEVPKGKFATYIKGLPLTTYKTKFDVLERTFPTMSDAEWQQVQNKIREKYAVHISNIHHHRNAQTSMDTPEDPDHDPTTPANIK